MQNYITKKTAVLLVNLGTPDGTGFWQVRRYLKQFLSDKRIIELNPLLWKLILNIIILNTRPSKTAANYKRIWDKTTKGSPLLAYTQAQCLKLNQLFFNDSIANRNKQIKVFFAMRYGNPSVKSAIEKIIEEKFEKILILPLFPQYSATTTASVYDEVFLELMKLRNIPEIKTIKSYKDHPAFIKALAKNLQRQLQNLDFEPDILLASYHGIPKSYSQKGDPYESECIATTIAIAKELNLSKDKLKMSFQSRFGNEEWLQPYTDKSVEKFAQEGIKKIAVFNPGFISDCLETIDEIGREIKEEFIENGGQKFAHLKCLNDSDEAINMLYELIVANLN